MEDVNQHLKNIKETLKRKAESSQEATEAKELACRPVGLTKYRNERNLMLYPFCSTSKRKRLKTIEYKSSDGKRWLEVTANHKFGMAKIWDFDILRFALSKAGEIKNIIGYFPPFVEFTVYECLKHLGRNPESGKNVKWFREALPRLMSTTYRGNIFKDDANIEIGFTLIGYEYIEETSRGGSDKVRITFDERLVDSVRYQNSLLVINSDVIKEESGIKKRLLELIKTSKGESKEWSVKLNRLQQMCAHEGALKEFKRQIKRYKLPWKLAFSNSVNGEDKITFFD